MKRKDYEKLARLLAQIANLAMKAGDYGKAEEYLKCALTAIENARKPTS